VEQVPENKIRKCYKEYAFVGLHEEMVSCMWHQKRGKKKKKCKLNYLNIKRSLAKHDITCL
jgi:hypothetical protein